MKIVVYLGPSLPVEEARAILDADYRPPVRFGDVIVATLEEADVIVIIDGLFQNVASVRHKEILFALSKGIRVFGASSMGALRASELTPFGMVGLGSIFEKFHSGEWPDDDEVTIAHATADDDFRPLSEAMANIRWGLEQAKQAGILEAAVADEVQRRTKERFYPERSWGLVIKELKAIAPEQASRFEGFLRDSKPDRKREDARLALEHVRDFVRAEVSRFEPEFDFESTGWFRHFWIRDARARHVLSRVSSAGVRARELATYVRLWGSPEHGELHHATLTYLATKKHAVDLLFADEEVEAQVREAVSLFGPFDDESVRGAANSRSVIREYIAGANTHVTDAQLVLALAHDPRIRVHHDAIAARKAWAREKGLDGATLDSAHLEERRVLEWYASRRNQPVAESLDALAESAGVGSRSAAEAELTAEYLYRSGGAP